VQVLLRRCTRHCRVSSCRQARSGLNPARESQRKSRCENCIARAGSRLVADNDEALVYQVVEHTREAHPGTDLTEDQAREMVAAEASDTEDPSY
jgi:predicted small metal-binding protein